jgi:hypothetical protein
MGESGCIDRILLTSALVGGKWSASHPGRFTPWEISSGTHWIGGWLGPRASLDNIEKCKLLTLPGLELRSLCRLDRLASVSLLTIETKICCSSHRNSMKHTRLFNISTSCRLTYMSVKGLRYFDHAIVA